mmetsp:Transcript_30262/g.41028  ORF Transcript_30262/g.41028 Transcript_30262/m.41028 type:complete len:132 (-) Transcript_30262:131-526(-)|eukprot:CAMPEP_0176348506 /NCGR_PEP_ID=MMETSP0126-20121128/7921_1 /TAXON_ID=141414 ORGANISM="Strombidinopsis acuminatum, Strain SPMC142" /NCGR_SAMPLE_ID=MMETSP0126 /ASSEMBLY_ACC=CAM_ASM_000229 /LENGTH=131 /DNA_ID=CAMNT_0017697341 /DNA_START=292 /DNA_END=687 /DNA_ORIENTATION=-
MEKEIEKTNGAQITLQETLNGIESAQADINIMAALKKGDQVLKELQSKASMEDWEELYDSHQDAKARYDMEVDLFGEALNDEEMEAELDALVADDIADKELNQEVSNTLITKEQADRYQEANATEEEAVEA